MEKREFDKIDRIHSGLPVLDPPAGLVDRIMLRVEEEESGRAGWLWKVMVPAAAAAFVLMGIGLGSRIHDSFFRDEEPMTAEAMGLEYLADYPPDSFGHTMELAARGGDDE